VYQWIGGVQAAGGPTTWAFHDPFRHPTDRSNDVKPTVITTSGNDPVELEKLMTSSKLNGSCNGELTVESTFRGGSNSHVVVW
jgi:hypothetical protein